jgi:hypothetical protein
MVGLRACSPGFGVVGRFATAGENHRGGNEQEEKRAMHQNLSFLSVAAEP